MRPLKDLEIDIVKVLRENDRLRFTEIKDKLFDKYNRKYNYAEDTFETILSRSLLRLCDLQMLEKEYEEAIPYYRIKSEYKEFFARTQELESWRFLSSRLTDLVDVKAPRACLHVMNFKLGSEILAGLESYFRMKKKSMLERRKILTAFLEVSFFEYQELLEKLTLKLLEVDEKEIDVENMLREERNRFHGDYKKFRPLWLKVLSPIIGLKGKTELEKEWAGIKKRGS